MNRYLKLVNFEFNRIVKVFCALLAFTLVFQIAGVIVISKNYMAEANHWLNGGLHTKKEFIADNGTIGMLDIGQSLWFLGPIALCAAAVAFYIFLIWYRDWFGKNAFIYRLLMLPTTRLNVFFAKITTILLMTFGFVAFQLILLPIESTILKWMVPRGFRVDMSVQEFIENSGVLNIVIQHQFTQFLLSYGSGLTAVAVLFTAILFERSYHLKGIFMGVGYSILAIIIFVMPELIQAYLFKNFFYPEELFVLMILTGLIVLFGSFWVSGILLRKKITV